MYIGVYYCIVYSKALLALGYFAGSRMGSDSNALSSAVPPEDPVCHNTGYNRIFPGIALAGPMFDHLIYIVLYIIYIVASGLLLDYFQPVPEAEPLPFTDDSEVACVCMRCVYVWFVCAHAVLGSRWSRPLSSGARARKYTAMSLHI